MSEPVELPGGDGVPELRDRGDAEAWLAGGLCLMRLGQLERGEHVRVAPWLLDVLAELGAVPPAGVIADIGQLAGGRALSDIRPVPVVPGELGQALAAYDDHVLGRLEADPRLDAVVDAVARLAGPARARAVARLAAQVLGRLGGQGLIAVSPGVVRRLREQPVDELLGAGYAALAGEGPAVQALIAGYRGLVAGARRAGSLLSEADVFVVEHIDVLGGLSERLAIAQMIEAAEALAASLPRRLKPRPERGAIPTVLAAEDDYPAGGFVSLARAGRIENLVISELAYMEDPGDGAGDEGRSAGAAEPVDLFELRYAEGELLYYTRDESVFVRGRRVITFVHMPDLAAARFKDRGLRWQRLVLALGLVVCCVRRLVAWLEREGLQFRLVFVARDAAGEVAEPGGRRASGPLAEEQALIALVLRDWIARQVVEIAQVPDVAAAWADAAEQARQARCDVLVVASEPQELRVLPGVRAGGIFLAEAEPRLTWAHRPGAARGAGEAGEDMDEASELWPAWTALALELLRELL